MADLRQLFTGLGLQDAKTYIQSGNVVFSSDREQQALAPLIKEAFERRFGFYSAVVVRSGAEMASIVGSLPFKAAEVEEARRAAPDVEHLYVYLSESALDSEEVDQLCAPYSGHDRYQVTDKEVYVLCFQGIRASRLPSQLLKMPQPLTFRNLNTMRKVSSML